MLGVTVHGTGASMIRSGMILSGTTHTGMILSGDRPGAGVTRFSGVILSGDHSHTCTLWDMDTAITAGITGISTVMAVAFIQTI